MSHKNHSFLVIDDDLVFNQTLCRTLNRRVKETYSAQNMQQALDAVDKYKPDCAVLDLNLGDENGIDFITPMLQRHPNLKILILTGYSSLTTAVKAVKMGAINYLAKPVDVDTILNYLQDEAKSDVNNKNNQDVENYKINEKDDKEREKLLPLSLENLEWEHIQRILSENDGNITVTARKLGMHRRTLQRKLQKKTVRRDRLI